MRVASVVFALLVLVAGVSCQTATKCPPGVPLVQCFADPCSVTTCKPSNPAWKCVANYCGGCNTQWIYTTTGLTINNCPPDACTFIYRPVCGTDGKTYSNACIALTNGIAVASQGECPPCPTTASPVCGADGITYRNKCLAVKNGTTVAYDGSCSFPTQCAKANLFYSPVCDGATLLTWTNACVADLNKIAGYTTGPCISGPCARCTSTSGCNAAHRCKGSRRYTCEQATCSVVHILDDGRRVTYGLCAPIYKDRATGYPAAACFP